MASRARIVSGAFEKRAPESIKLYEFITGPVWPFRSGTSEMVNA